MFLDDWIVGFEAGLGWPAAIFLLLGLGMGIGCFYTRFRRLFYVILTFWLSLHFLALLFSGYFPGGWTKNLLGRVQASPDSLRFWLFVLLSVAMVFLVMGIRKGEIFGRFFAAFFLVLNLYFLLVAMSEWVGLLRFVRALSLQTVLWVSVFFAGGSLFVPGLPGIVSSCVGSALVVIGYLQVLQRLGESDTFFGQSPFALFVFLVLAILMKAFQGEYREKA
ncbi:MAG TPA: hypothetical protein VLH40_02830 [Atribacteraceae bacterium]|nr:hypothetical protein [Atribacteraceae bacterium]